MEGGVVMNDSTHELHLCPILSSQLNLKIPKRWLKPVNGIPMFLL